MYVLSKNVKNIKIFLVKFSIFTAGKIYVCCMGFHNDILHLDIMMYELCKRDIDAANIMQPTQTLLSCAILSFAPKHQQSMLLDKNKKKTSCFFI